MYIHYGHNKVDKMYEHTLTVVNNSNVQVATTFKPQGFGLVVRVQS